MSREKWESLTRKELQDLAQKKGVTGITRKTKDELVAELVKVAKAKARARARSEGAKTRPRSSPQLIASTPLTAP